MRTATASMSVFALVLLAAAAAWAGSSSRPPLVPCDNVIAWVKSGRGSGYRVVLGVVSVPPAHLRQVVPTDTRPWRYWRKAGLVVHAGKTGVSVSVPKEWRSRAAITWGNQTGIVSSLRILGCPAPPNVWNAYAGGFYLRARSACVPLVFRVGNRTRVVRFGIGRTCGP
jgi:hypothetical protein